jgi:hypothetical protein
MWCGSFVTFCLARCGLRKVQVPEVTSVGKKIVGKTGGDHYSFDVTSKTLKMPKGKDLERFNTDPKFAKEWKENRHNYKFAYGGHYGVGVGDKEKVDDAKSIHSGQDIDIRAGDVFYSQTHTGIIIGVHKTAELITVVTAEGNANNRVESEKREIKIKNGAVESSPFQAWARPFGSGTPAPQDDSWVASALQDEKHKSVKSKNGHHSDGPAEE